MSFLSGAQVVLLRKVDSIFLDGLVNGSRGVVIRFEEATKDNVKITKKLETWIKNHPLLPVIRFASGQEAVVPPIEWDVWNGDRYVTLFVEYVCINKIY